MRFLLLNTGSRAGLRQAAIGVLASAALAAPSLAAASPELSDRSIADAVDDELLFDPAVVSQSIDVENRDGVVTLTGVTDNILAKERATAVARSVKGVRTVVNAIEVKPPPHRTGTMLQSHVIDALTDDPATESYQIDVIAAGAGLVVLRGTVDSWPERQLAAAVAKGVSGVTGLNNELKVDYTASDRTDGEIEAEIVRRLNWDVLVEGASIDVAVTDREVVLSGVVGSAAERSRAMRFAHVNGVRDVVAEGLEVHDWANTPYQRDAMPVFVADDEVAQAVEDAFLYDPRLDPADLSASVEDGTVTLRGSVPSLAARRSAERDARNTVGVLDVVNRLKVKRTSQQTDQDLKKRIEAALTRDPYVEGHEISVVAFDGVVKLYGLVDNYFEKSRADQAVEGIRGVVTTVNNLGVRDRSRALVYDPFVSAYPPERYDWYDYQPRLSFKKDANIRDNIEDQLWWSPFVDADQVTVDVVDGTAILTGEVDSYAEWQAASENAWEGGAVWVDNELTIRDSQS